MKRTDLSARGLVLPATTRLPLYYACLVETLKLLDQWADQHPCCAPALAEPELLNALIRALDDCAAIQVVADVNGHLLPTLTRPNPFADLPADDFLSFCLVHQLLDRGNPAERFDPADWALCAETYRAGLKAWDPCRAVAPGLLQPLTLGTLRHRLEGFWNGLALLCHRFMRLRADLGRIFFKGDEPVALLRIQPLDQARRRGFPRALTLTVRLSSGRETFLHYRNGDMERECLLAGDLTAAWAALDADALESAELRAALTHLRDKRAARPSLLERLRASGYELPEAYPILPCQPLSAYRLDDQERLPGIGEAFAFALPSAPTASEQAMGGLAALSQLLGLAWSTPLGQADWPRRLDRQHIGLAPSLAETEALSDPRDADDAHADLVELAGGWQGLSLLRREPPGPHPRAPQRGKAFAQGYQESLRRLAAAPEPLLAFLDECRDVLVRVQPYPPALLELKLRHLTGPSARLDLAGKPRPWDTPELVAALSELHSEERRRWVREASDWLARNPQADPNAPLERARRCFFLQPAYRVLGSTSLLWDLLQDDAPCFHHRLGGRELFGADGRPIRALLDQVDQPELARALLALYGHDRESPYFPLDLLTLTAQHLHCLSQDEAYRERLVEAGLNTLRRHDAPASQA